MAEDRRHNIRRLLKKFGIKTDEVIIAHLAKLDNAPELHLRITLEDLTDYKDKQPDLPLSLEITGTV